MAASKECDSGSSREGLGEGWLSIGARCQLCLSLDDLNRMDVLVDICCDVTAKKKKKALAVSCT